MSDLNPELEKILNNLGLSAQDVIKANQRLRDSNTDAVKSLTRQAMEMAAAHKQRIAAAEKELKADGLRGDALKKEARVRADLQRTLEDQADDEEKSLRRSQELDSKREAGIKKLLSDIGGLGSSAMSASASFYASKEVFTSVIPTLDLVGNAFKTVVEATAMIVSGWEIAGFSLEKSVEGAAKLAGIATDIAIKTAEMQLQMSQKYLDTYNNLSAVGVTFGGNLNDMSRAAHDGGLDLQTYGDFVKKNIESLSTMGGTVEQSAGRIMKMSKAVTDGSDKLLVMFGGFEGVNDALAFHSKMLAQTGYDTVKNQDKIAAGSAGYLTTLKELQEITGMTVDQQQKAQEELQKDVAYRMKLAQLREAGRGDEADASWQKYLITLKTRGPQEAALYKEKFTLDGKLLSQSGMMLDAQSQSARDYTNNLMQINDKETDVRLKNIGKLIITSNEQAKAEREAKGGLASIFTYAGANDDYTKIMLDHLREGLDTSDAASNIDKTIANAIETANKPLAEGAGKDVAAALRAKLAANIEVDNLIETQLKEMANITKQLINLQVQLITTFGPNLTSAVDAAISGMLNLAKTAGKVDLGKGGNTGTGGSIGRKVLSYGGTALGATVGAIGGSAFTPVVGTALGGIAGGMAGKEWGEKIADYFGMSKSETPTSDYESLLKFSGGVTGDKTHFGKMNATTRDAFGKMVAEYGSSVTVNSSYRSPEEQAAMYAEWKAAGGDKTLRPTVATPTFGRLTTPTPPGARDSHTMGVALDLDKGDYAKLNAKGLLAKYGFAMVPGDEGHIQKLAKGGITNGTSIAGEAGPEAVVPLPDGRTIPVKMDMGQLVNKFEEMISVMKDQLDTSEKIHRAVS